MRICGNGPAAVRRGAVGIGAGRDFGHSMEANALVQQTSRGRFGILRRRSPADRLRPDSAPRILPAQTPKARLASPRLTYFVPIRLRMSLVQQTPRGRFGILRRRSPADRLRPDRAPRILPVQAPKARLTSPHLTYFVPIRLRMPLVQQTRAGDSAYYSGAPPPTGSGLTARRAYHLAAPHAPFSRLTAPPRKTRTRRTARAPRCPAA